MYLPTGWTSLVHGDIFIVQSSQGGAPAVAEAAIKSGVSAAWSLGRRCVTLFPEGGFFRKRHPRSVEWLKKQDAAAVHPKFTALPRSGGFCNMLGVVGQDFEGVLDVTVRYERGGALAPEIPILFMGTDEAVYLDVEWIMKRDVPPSGDPAAVQTWLTQRFAHKDELMTAAPSLYKPLSSVRLRAIAHLLFHSASSPAAAGVRPRVSPRRSRPRVPLAPALLPRTGWPQRRQRRRRRVVPCDCLPCHAHTRKVLDCSLRCSRRRKSCIAIRR